MHTLALLLDFDGTLDSGDLSVQAYARHVAEQVADPFRATAVIDGMREFLEGKHADRTERLAVDLSTAEDGDHAVEILAAAAGLTKAQTGAAYRAARADLAGSAFALDAADGLSDLLTKVRGSAVVAVATNAGDLGVRAVLDSIGLAPMIDEVITNAGKPGSMPGIIDRLLGRLGGPSPERRLLAVGPRWGRDLATAHSVGAPTAYIDRFDRGDGKPTWRARQLASMIEPIRDWAIAQLDARRAASGVGR